MIHGWKKLGVNSQLLKMLEENDDRFVGRLLAPSLQTKQPNAIQVGLGAIVEPIVSHPAEHSS